MNGPAAERLPAKAPASKEKVTDLLLFVIGTGLVGAASSLLSEGNFKAFYDSLTKPPLAPPGWLFSVAWVILYILMAVSAYMIYSTDHPDKIKALAVYAGQLFINFLWSPVFFRFKSLVGAAIVVTVLLFMVAAMMKSFYKINKTAALINIPYLLWTAYALYLTYGFLVLNI
ncbi:MAG: tryptophan-rich sensory protein [Ruminococcus sp.]|nr:tryptophan-rich sensory protein [Ruminococcus sp.]